MIETFYGPWTVELVNNIVATPQHYAEQFIIAGSDASDGAYPGVPGHTPALSVSGEEWTITMENREHPTQPWVATVSRSSATYTSQEGLVVYLSSDDNKYNTNIILRCQSLDPKHGPMQTISYDFTVSREAMARYRLKMSQQKHGH